MDINADGRASFPLVMVGGVLVANKKWDIGKEVVDFIRRDYHGVLPIRPKVIIFLSFNATNLELSSLGVIELVSTY